MVQGSKTNMTQYRSTLSAVFKVLREIRVPKEEHVQQLKKTPFWFPFEVFLSNKVDLSFCRKHNEDAEQIVKCYHPDMKGFKLGVAQTIVRLRHTDIQLIFGVSCGHQPMNVSYANKSKNASSFIARRFPDAKKLEAPSIKEQLVNALKGDTKEDFEDVARLLCLYLCVTLFFPSTGQSLSWGFVSYIEDLEAMKTYAWSKEICNWLSASLDKKSNKPPTVTGCVIALQYWLCEHTTILQPEEGRRSNDVFPRFLKWNLYKLHTELIIKPMKTLEETEVMGGELEKTDHERKVLGNERGALAGSVEEEEQVIVMHREKKGDDTLFVGDAAIKREDDDHHNINMDCAEDSSISSSRNKNNMMMMSLKRLMVQLEQENAQLKLQNKRLRAEHNTKVEEMQQKLDQMKNEITKFEYQRRDLLRVLVNN